jgi:hypothetical protein
MGDLNAEASKVIGMAEVTRRGAITKWANPNPQKDVVGRTMEGEGRVKPINPRG